MQSHQLKTVEDVRQFMFAGNATVTLVSRKTGTRFTFKVTKPKDEGSKVTHFVALMNGSDNEGDYAYLGHFFGRDHYVHGKKSYTSSDAPSARAFAWFAGQLAADKLPDTLEVWHEGRCGACGRKLTVPSSIATGLGPECASKRGIPMYEAA